MKINFTLTIINVILTFKTIQSHYFYGGSDVVREALTAMLNDSTFMHRTRISNNCSLSLLELTKSIDGLLPYVDASGKPGDGILQGNTWMIGSFDECTANQNAHFCTMTNVALNISTSKQELISLRAYGLCVPQTCDVIDTTNLLKFLSNVLEHKIGYKIVVVVEDDDDSFGRHDSYCHVKTKTFSTGATVMLVVTGVIAVLCCIGTIIDFVKSLVKFYRSWSPTEDEDHHYDKNEFLIEAEYFNSRSSLSSSGSDILTPKIQEDLRILSMHSVTLDSSSKLQFLEFLEFRENQKKK